MPPTILADQDMPPRIRVLAWLIFQGATRDRTVRVAQPALARALNLSRQCVNANLRALGRAGYIVAEINPVIGGHVHSYRLGWKGATQ